MSALDAVGLCLFVSFSRWRRPIGYLSNNIAGTTNYRQGRIPIFSAVARIGHRLLRAEGVTCPSETLFAASISAKNPVSRQIANNPGNASLRGEADESTCGGSRFMCRLNRRLSDLTPESYLFLACTILPEENNCRRTMHASGSEVA